MVEEPKRISFLSGQGDGDFEFCQAIVNFGQPGSHACLKPQAGVAIVHKERFAVCDECFRMLEATVSEIKRRIEE